MRQDVLFVLLEQLLQLRDCLVVLPVALELLVGLVKFADRRHERLQAGVRAGQLLTTPASYHWPRPIAVGLHFRTSRQTMSLSSRKYSRPLAKAGACRVV